MREHRKYSREKPRDRVARVLGILTAPTVLNMDANRRTYLIAFVDRYLPLVPSERGDLERRMQGTGEEVMEQVMTYYERQGYDRGIAQGLRRAVLRLLTAKFGDLPSSARERLEGIQSEEELEALLDRIDSATTLNDLELAPA